MSVIQWAKTVRCDWPECSRQGEVVLGESWPGRSLPPGWVDLSQSLAMTGFHGERLAEFCPQHAQESLQSLAVAFPGRDVSRETSKNGGPR